MSLNRKRTTNPLKEEKENHGWLTSRKNGKEEEEVEKNPPILVVYNTALQAGRQERKLDKPRYVRGGLLISSQCFMAS